MLAPRLDGSNLIVGRFDWLMLTPAHPVPLALHDPFTTAVYRIIHIVCESM